MRRGGFASNAILALAVGLATVCVLTNVWPWHPQTFRGWIVLVALAVPLIVVGEAVGEWFTTRNPVSWQVERATKAQTFSWLRLAYYLVVLVGVVVLFGLIGQVGRW